MPILKMAELGVGSRYRGTALGRRKLETLKKNPESRLSTQKAADWIVLTH
jgi:hypothetical protein